MAERILVMRKIAAFADSDLFYSFRASTVRARLQRPSAPTPRKAAT